MKRITHDLFHTTLYFNEIETKNINLDNEEELETCFKHIFLKLKRDNENTVSGYYQVKVYQDLNYGMVVDLQKEDIECYGYFQDQIDMRIIVTPKRTFYYLLDELFNLDDLKSKLTFLVLKDKFYAKTKEKLSFIEMGRLLENSTIIYDDETYELEHHGKIMQSGL